MKLLRLTTLAAVFSTCVAAQPVDLQKGDAVTVVMGSGTDMKPGTKLRGTVTRSDEEGLGFRVAKHGTYWIKWAHIRSVNGARLESDRAFAAAAAAIGAAPATGAESATPEPPSAPSPAPAPAASSEAERSRGVTSDGSELESTRHRDSESAPASRGYPRERSRFDDEPGRGYKIAAALDYFGVGNAANSSDVKDLPSNVCALANASLGPGSSCTATLSINGAIGFRGGFWKPAEGFEWGASFGYLYGGPNGSGKLTVDTVPAGSGTLTQSDNTVRLLGEVRKSIPLNDQWSLRMGVGLGVAFDFWNASCSASGNLTGGCAALGLQSSESGSQTWATWELSPSIAYGRWSAGFRYAGFGRTQSTPWNTFGGFFGAEF